MAIMATRRSVEMQFDISLPKGISRDKLDIICAGVELGYLTKDDILYIASKDCNIIRAENRLIAKRKEHD